MASNCPRVRARIFCDECGYSRSEARYTEDKDQRFHPHIPDDASFSEFTEIINSFKDSLKTNPPADVFNKEHGGEPPDYDNGTEVKWVCQCGCDKFNCYFEEGHYRTFIICLDYGAKDDVHTG